MSNEQFAALENIGGGALAEQFAIDLQKVLQNITDPNTDPLKKRTITIKFTLSPNLDRDWARVQVDVDASGSFANRPIETSIEISKLGSIVVAVEHPQPRQTSLLESNYHA